jgi:hypothetical protein
MVIALLLGSVSPAAKEGPQLTKGFVNTPEALPMLIVFTRPGPVVAFSRAE